MSNKTLALVLAAGEGSRVKCFLNDDEPVKAMIKLGEKRLIDRVLDSLDEIEAEKAVLSYPSIEYESLDKRVKERGVKVLKQSTKQRILPNLFQLPWILITQYYFSDDREYLKSFDSIMTLPCDIVIDGNEVNSILKFHEYNLMHPSQIQITILSRYGPYEGGNAAVFKMDGYRIVGVKSHSYHTKGYEVSTQAGIFVFSKGVLNPISSNISGFKVLRYLTEAHWTDYGNPKTLEKLANNKPF